VPTEVTPRVLQPEQDCPRSSAIGRQPRRSRPWLPVGAYVNFLDRDDADRVPAAYGDATYRRLVALNDRHDPDNLFCLNHNIRPTTISRGAGVPNPARTPG
jgi:hypothetical protein